MGAYWDNGKENGNYYIITGDIRSSINHTNDNHSNDCNSNGSGNGNGNRTSNDNKSGNKASVWELSFTFGDASGACSERGISRRFSYPKP